MAYAFLADGRSEQELLQLDVQLSPTPDEDRAKALDRANAAAMQQLRDQLAGIQGAPMPRRRTT